MKLSDTTEATLVNTKLRERYGLHTVVNKPNFRVSWAGDQVEKRGGEKAVYAGDVFLKMESGIHEVKKYNFLDDDQWVIERLVPNLHPDVYEGDYTYEPIFAFPKGLPLSWKAVEFFMVNIFHTRRQPKTENQALTEENERKEKAIKKTREILDEVDTVPVGTGIAGGHSVSFSGGDYRPSKNGDNNA